MFRFEKYRLPQDIRNIGNGYPNWGLGRLGRGFGAFDYGIKSGKGYGSGLEAYHEYTDNTFYTLDLEQNTLHIVKNKGD